MRYRTVQGICIGFLCAGLALYMAPCSFAAEEAASSAAREGASEQNGPAIHFEPEGGYFFGYEFVSQEDSLKAAEYVYPHSSITFGIDLLAAPLPHRYHLNGEYLNKYDFYGDGGYAYKDLFMFRNLLVGIHHNLDHFYYDFQGQPPSIVYTDRNRADSYFIDYVNNLFFTRLKAPDFPLHAFVKQRYVEREGSVEQRFLLGSFGNLNKTSATRAIDWKSNAETFGFNSHLGPLEVEYAYDQADFDPGGNSVLYDLYPSSGSFSRPGDIYPHNVVPETESSGNTLKMHTSYTGGIVAAATLSNLSEKNNYSGTESSLWKGAFDVSWIPDPVLGFFFKYRHKDLDMDTPDTVTLAGVANVLSYPVRQGISYNRDNFAVSARYKPLNRLSLFSTYEFSHLERRDIDEWLVLPDRTDIHSINLTAHSRPMDKLKLKAVYDYRHYDSPAYNTSPDNSNRLRLSATYLPLPWLTAYADYMLAVTERDDLRYINPISHLLVENGERDGRIDRLFASLSFMFSPKVTVTGSWAYNRWKVEQDLAYSRWNAAGGVDFPFIDPGVPYTDESNSFSLALNYVPREDITVTADVSYTLSDGEYAPSDVSGGALAIASYSELEAAETIFSLEVTKKLPRNWEAGIRFYSDIYDDRTGDLLDGSLFITTLTLKRHF